VESVSSLPAALQSRALANVHIRGNTVEPREDVRVFIGNLRCSTRFDSAVDLEIRNDHGLLCSTIRSKKGLKLSWDRSPRWSSSIRACRAVLDLAIEDDRAMAKIIRDAIKKANPRYDLLAEPE